MDFEKCIQERRSVRKYKSDKISRAAFEKIVRLASYSPSWKNTQVTRWILVEDEAVKNRIAQEAVLGFEFNSKTIQNAPNLVVQTIKTGISGFERDGSPSTSKGDHWETYDAGISVQSFSLAAYDSGFGVVILGIFDEHKVAEILSLPEGQKVAALLPIGIPDETPAAPKRKAAEDLLSYV